MIQFGFVGIVGDVISGTTSGGIHHPGILEGWFGVHWWTGRTFVVVFTTLAVFVPLVSLKRIGECTFLALQNDDRLDDNVRKMTQTLDSMDESFHFIICKLKKMVTRSINNLLIPSVPNWVKKNRDFILFHPISYDQTIISLTIYYFQTSNILQYDTNKLKKKWKFKMHILGIQHSIALKLDTCCIFIPTN